MKSLPSKMSTVPTSPNDNPNAGTLVVRPTLGGLVIMHLTEVSEVRPVPKPVFSLSHAQAGFMTRLGAAILYVTHSIEHSISPSGTLRAFIKLFIKWFITLTLLFCVVGSVGFVAAYFIAAISNLLKLASQQLFFFALYLAGTVLLLALLGAGVVMLLKKMKCRKRNGSLGRGEFR